MGSSWQHHSPTETRSAPALRVILGGPLQLLEILRAQIAEGSMPTMIVVPALDEVEDRHAGCDLSTETLAIEQLALEGGEEALAHGVVEAIANGSHRRADSRLAAALAEGDRGVLAPLIGVMDHRRRPTLPQSHAQGLEDELGTQMCRHRPAHHPATPGIQHHREVENPR